MGRNKMSGKIFRNIHFLTLSMDFLTKDEFLGKFIVSYINKSVESFRARGLIIKKDRSNSSVFSLPTIAWSSWLLIVSLICNPDLLSYQILNLIFIRSGLQIPTSHNQFKTYVMDKLKKQWKRCNRTQIKLRNSSCAK